MATNAQRTAAICDAIINGTSTVAQQTRLARALYETPLGGPTFEDLTNGQKAAIIPAAVRRWALERVHQQDVHDAAAAAAAAGAAAADFPEGP